MDLKWGSGKELTNSQSHEQDNPTKVCWCKGATNLMEVKCVQDLIALNRSCVREEVEDVIKRLVLPHLHSLQSPALPPCESSASLQLHFVGDLPDTLLTLNNIQDEGASPVLELRDSLASKIEVGPESCAKIQIVVLDGDFEVEDRDHWTNEEFNKNVLLPRIGKRPLLVGDHDISLSKGVATISNICLTDNSKWTRSGKFRLGARVVKGVPPGIVIREAVSKAFQVKERRLQAYRKHKIPTLEDEIWRLESIAKVGPIRQRLAGANVHTLKDFLQLYHTNAKQLQKILQVPEKRWWAIVKNAELCSLTDEHYRYYDKTTGFELLLDCVFKIVSITFVGENQNCHPYGTLDFQKEYANKLRENAYEIRNDLPKIYVPSNQVMVLPQSICSSSIPCTDIQHINAVAIDQGEQVLHMNYYSSSLQPYPLGHEEHDYESEFLNSILVQAEGDNDIEASINDNVTSKLKAVCNVTKAAILFMISIQQDSFTPLKKQKL